LPGSGSATGSHRLELAASCVGVHGIQGTAELLDYSLLSLWQGRRTALQRHQTLNAMLDWSYNLLSEHEKLVLRRLSFVGGFTLQAARSVVSEADTDEADSSSVVVSLVAKSLISTNEINRSIYYRLLDTTRARSQSGSKPQHRRRHTGYSCPALAIPSPSVFSAISGGKRPSMPAKARGCGFVVNGLAAKNDQANDLHCNDLNDSG
jgi:hypothetical protein